MVCKIWRIFYLLFISSLEKEGNDQQLDEYWKWEFDRFVHISFKIKWVEKVSTYKIADEIPQFISNKTSINMQFNVKTKASTRR
jgi:hypothetical protein